MKLDIQTLRGLYSVHGDAFYILDRNRFANNYRNFLAAFRKRYKNSNIAYSYKTNYLPQLCKFVDDEGGYAEVVSAMEYELAVRLGVPAERIVFNGPLKTAEDLERAILSGAIVNLDSHYEIENIKRLSSRYPERTFYVGLRCNFPPDAGFTSRFGFDTSDAALSSAVKELGACRNVRLRGLHCHSSVFRDKKSFQERVTFLLGLVKQYFKNEPPGYIDVGGGFAGGIDPELSGQFEYPIPGYDEYAEAITSVLSGMYQGGDTPELLLEPGVALTADVMCFVARVIDVKDIRGRKYALTSGSVHNIKPTMHTLAMPCDVVVDNDGQGEDNAVGPVDIVGYTCMEHDCLHESYRGPVKAGDFVVFRNVGAYTIVFKPPFIRPAPPVLMLNEEENVYQVVRRQETFDDVFSTYGSWMGIQ